MKLTDPRLDLIARDLGMKAISPVIAVAGLVIEGRETAAIAERLGTGVDQVRAIADRVRALIDVDKAKRSNKAREKNPSALTYMTEDFRLSEKSRKYATEIGLTASDIDFEEKKFRQWFLEKKERRDWHRTWINWANRAAERLKERASPNGIRVAENAPSDVAPEMWRKRLETFRDLGAWQASFGPEPGQRGCKVPPEILREVRV